MDIFFPQSGRISLAISAVRRSGFAVFGRNIGSIKNNVSPNAGETHQPEQKTEWGPQPQEFRETFSAVTVPIELISVPAISAVGASDHPQRQTAGNLKVQKSHTSRRKRLSFDSRPSPISNLVLFITEESNNAGFYQSALK
ncbi:MAG: hypothetical protein MK102_01765 [Fuerstiella sp.]|nr:hypothetical protein [Fuerstiella sp.]